MTIAMVKSTTKHAVWSRLWCCSRAKESSHAKHSMGQIPVVGVFDNVEKWRTFVRSFGGPSRTARPALFAWRPIDGSPCQSLRGFFILDLFASFFFSDLLSQISLCQTFFYLTFFRFVFKGVPSLPCRFLCLRFVFVFVSIFSAFVSSSSFSDLVRKIFHIICLIAVVLS